MVRDTHPDGWFIVQIVSISICICSDEGLGELFCRRFALWTDNRIREGVLST